MNISLVLSTYRCSNNNYNSHLFSFQITTTNSHWLNKAAAAAAKSLQSCLALCDPTDGSPPGSPIPGILQARTLEWVAISFSNAWNGKVKVKSLSRVQLLATPWTVAHQAPLSMGFSRQEYWSGVPFAFSYYYTTKKLKSKFHLWNVDAWGSKGKDP